MYWIFVFMLQTVRVLMILGYTKCIFILCTREREQKGRRTQRGWMKKKIIYTKVKKRCKKKKKNFFCCSNAVCVSVCMRWSMFECVYTTESERICADENGFSFRFQLCMNINECETKEWLSFLLFLGLLFFFHFPTGLLSLTLFLASDSCT